jgi:3-hydroxymyristoyl/3-hydroxydecanoyl-(acyl carrier protein) dehydratase
MNAVREQIRSMLTAESRDGGFRARLRVDPAFVLFPDHFSSQPIFPGICMLQAVLLAAGMARGRDELHLKQLKNSKLLQPVLPGDEVLIDGEIAGEDDGDLAIKARLFVADQKRAEFSLIARGTFDNPHLAAELARVLPAKTRVSSAATPLRADNAPVRGELTPSPGTPGEGGGEGDFACQRRPQFKITLTPTLSLSTGRGGRGSPGVIRAKRNKLGYETRLKRVFKSLLRLPTARCATSGVGAFA